MRRLKKTSKCQVISLTVREKTKVGPNWRTSGQLGRAPGALKEGIFGLFLTSILLQNTEKKLREGLFGEKQFWENKSHNAEKTEREDLLVSRGIVCYAKKKKKLLYFSSLGQILQFDTIKFCRTL